MRDLKFNVYNNNLHKVALHLVVFIRYLHHSGPNTGLLHILKSYGISGQIFGLISSFLSNRQLQVVLDGKSSQEYPVNAVVPQGCILGPTLFQAVKLPTRTVTRLSSPFDENELEKWPPEVFYKKRSS